MRDTLYLQGEQGLIALGHVDDLLLVLRLERCRRCLISAAGQRS